MPIQTPKKYFKTIILFEVLSEEEPVQWNSLADLNYQVTEGHCSGRLMSESSELISEEELRMCCRYHGTDPEFFTIPREEDEDAPASTEKKE